MSFNADGTLLAFDRLHIVDGATLVAKHNFEDALSAFSFSPDGTLFALATDKYQIQLWDVATWQEIRSFYLPGSNGVWSLEFTSDGRTLVASGWIESSVWNVATGDMVRRLSYNGYGGRLSPDGQKLAFFAGPGAGIVPGEAQILDLVSGSMVDRFPIGDMTGQWFEFTPNGRFLVVPNGVKVSIFSFPKGSLIASLDGDPSKVRAVAVSENGNYVASIGVTGRVCVWDISALNSYACTGFTISNVDWTMGCVTIKNTTSTPLDLLGWKISDGDTSFTFPDSITVAVGETYVACPAVYNPSKSSRGLTIDETDEQVMLYSPEVCGGTKESTKRQ